MTSITNSTQNSHDFLASGGEMGRKMRMFSWSETSLGPTEKWPANLRTSVSLCLNSPFPIKILWGDEFTLLYNDAFIPMLGDKHPKALGIPAQECFDEVWTLIEKMLKGVKASGKAAWSKDLLLPLLQSKNIKEHYFTLSYSPIFDEFGAVSGIFIPIKETTEKVIAERALKLLKKGQMADVGLTVARSEKAQKYIEEIAAEEYRNTKILQELSTLLISEDNIQTIYEEILIAAMAITKSQAGTVQIFDHSTQELVILATRGFSRETTEYFYRIDASSNTSCGAALRKGTRSFIKFDPQNTDIATRKHIEDGIFSAQSSPLISRSGKSIGMISTHWQKYDHYPSERELRSFDLLTRQASDLIDQRQAEKALRASEQKLKEADRRKDEFLAMLSHELRNPLAAISMNSFMLSRAPAGSETITRAQAAIERQLQQINRLIEDLLDVTRITQNKIQLRCQPLDINKLVNRTIEDNRILFENQEISLEVKLLSTPIMINADLTRIEQILSNLLQNAAKFSYAGSLVQVLVAKESQEVAIRVIDNGVGIEADLLEHLFKPFMQADRSLDRSRGGLGLGLALVKGIVELHGGQVSATSDGPDKGAIFEVRLPLDISNNLREVVETNHVKTNSSHIVLIIEDNVHIAESLGIIIEMLGHTIHIAHNGPEGIEKAEKINPHFILCDIGLPGMNGYQVAALLKSNKNLNVTLIALSGYAQQEDIKKCLAAGFDIHLSKPPDFGKLEEILASKNQT